MFSARISTHLISFGGQPLTNSKICLKSFGELPKTKMGPLLEAKIYTVKPRFWFLIFGNLMRKQTCEFFGTCRLNLPPSPPSWPVIGHIHLLGPRLHQSVAQLANKYGPIMLLRFGAKATLVISSPDMAREIFKEHDLVFSQRPRTIFLDIFNIAQKGNIFIIHFQIFDLWCAY